MKPACRLPAALFATLLSACAVPPEAPAETTSETSAVTPARAPAVPAAVPASAPLVAAPQTLEAIDTVVVVYAGSRSFDHVFGLFPGAHGIPGKNPASPGRAAAQKDLDGSVLPVLPPIWSGLTTNAQLLSCSR